MEKDILDMLKKIVVTQEQIVSTQNEMKQIEAARSVREAQIEEDVNRHQEAIYGNGKPGLKTDMQLVKESLKRINWGIAVFVAAVIADIASRVFAK